MTNNFTVILLIIITCSNFVTIAGELEIKLDSNKTISIYYETEGKGKPFFILHRGEKGYFEPVMGKYEGIKRIYIDPPGIGRSGSDEWINNADNCLEIILKVVDSLSDKQKFCIAGMSYFGYLARGIAVKRVNFVDGIVLICPVIYPEKNLRNLPAFKICEIDTAFINSLTVIEKESISSLAVQNRTSYEAIKKLSNDEVEMNSKFWQKIKENSYSLSFDPDNEKFINEIPVLLFVGLQDNVVGYKDAIKLFKIYNQLSFVALNFASHSLPYEQNYLFSQHLSNWLDQLKFIKK